MVEGKTLLVLFLCACCHSFRFQRGPDSVREGVDSTTKAWATCAVLSQARGQIEQWRSSRGFVKQAPSSQTFLRSGAK